MRIKDKLCKVTLAVAAAAMIVAGVPATAFAASDTQEVKADWVEITNIEDGHSYNWRVKTTVTVTNGIVSAVSFAEKGLNGAPMPETEKPYCTPVKNVFQTDIPDYELDATNPSSIYAIDSVSGATHTSYRFKQSVEQALTTWNSNVATVAPVTMALSSLTDSSSKATVTAARAAYDGLTAELKNYVPTAAYEKLTSAEAAIVAAEKAAADKAAAEKAAADKAAAAKAAEAKQKAITTVTVNVATVNQAAITAAITKAGGSTKYVTTIVLGSKVKTIKASAFKGTKVTTVTVKSTKLKKAKVKNCFKGSSVKTVKVPKAKKSAYKKIFTKANAGKKVTIK